MIQTDYILNAVKTDKGITDDSMDKALTNYIQQASDMVCLYVGEDSLPKQLAVIVIRMTEAHYVQTVNDADGTKSYSEEGASWSFQDNELDPYITLLEKYLANRDGSGFKGGAWSW
ncbi:phage head-tail connector protein [Limosilactobacillus vaginalis]|uniref:Phage DNA packaging protein n=1 Tax=Limosilactobacillus vaginalis DSM 5837 = ATCC 49540 TaxID=1423814 RepID=C2EWF0_9LACO|nr:phage head-tail connector protein [Limosilactobacillus vaginalis]EEJ39786.1 hypothetical protein HMPREF0549_1786 [Limosilactobacillus vaginalis DSM 5837 = ATCC 49540]KRM49078.1 prophage Lp1 protein 43 [Limosilactobacillus vaginalis DSM 5837 = ATCC 49540]